MSAERRDEFWKKFPGLVWSNSKASDSVMIRAALAQPRFHEILGISVEFGLGRVKRELEEVWDELTSPYTRSAVSGMLENITKGFERAEKADRRNLAQAGTAA